VDNKKREKLALAKLSYCPEGQFQDSNFSPRVKTRGNLCLRTLPPPAKEGEGGGLVQTKITKIFKRPLPALPFAGEGKLINSSLL
jgi:hypothetical protein